MTYNFDEIIDRNHTNAMNVEGFRDYIFHDSAIQFPFPDEHFVRMWVADMEFATPQVIIDAMQERLNRRIFGYTSVFDPGYYQAFASWTQSRYQWQCKKEDLFTSNGVIPTLYELVEHILKPDEKLLFLTRSYAYFKYAADQNNRGFVCSDLMNRDGRYTIDFADLEQKAQDAKTTLCIFCNPHNPTGRVWSPEELRQVGDILIRNNMWIISDEIHCDLLRMGQTHTPMAKVFPDYDKLITCMAPSKTFNMAGLRISNVIIPNKELQKTWLKYHYNSDNPLSIAAAQAAYEKGADWLDHLRVYLDENFAFTGDYLKKRLPKAVYQVSQATYLAWVDISAYLPGDTDLPLFFANKAAVLLEGGNMFVQHSDGYIRLNLACPRALLEEGLKRIADALLAAQ